MPPKPQSRRPTQVTQDQSQTRSVRQPTQDTRRSQTTKETSSSSSLSYPVSPESSRTIFTPSRSQTRELEEIVLNSINNNNMKAIPSLKSSLRKVVGFGVATESGLDYEQIWSIVDNFSELTNVMKTSMDAALAAVESSFPTTIPGDYRLAPIPEELFPILVAIFLRCLKFFKVPAEGLPALPMHDPHLVSYVVKALIGDLEINYGNVYSCFLEAVDRADPSTVSELIASYKRLTSHKPVLSPTEKQTRTEAYRTLKQLEAKAKVSRMQLKIISEVFSEIEEAMAKAVNNQEVAVRELRDEIRLRDGELTTDQHMAAVATYDKYVESIPKGEQAIDKQLFIKKYHMACRNLGHQVVTWSSKIDLRAIQKGVCWDVFQSIHTSDIEGILPDEIRDAFISMFSQ